MGLRVAMLAPIAWRVPPRHYGPWEQFASLLTEGLVERGVDVTLFASGDSRTAGRLSSVVPRGWEEDLTTNPKVSECLHISALFERAGEFDLIHNSFDFLPLTYSALVSTPVLTTIHGFSSPAIVAVYEKYDHLGAYIAISDADRHPRLTYLATIHHGIDTGRVRAARQSGRLPAVLRPHPSRQGNCRCHRGRSPGRPAAGHRRHHPGSAVLRRERRARNRRCAGALHRSRRARAPVGLLGGAIALLHLIGFEEPFGYSVVEAMACGTPVIAYRRGSMPELVEDGVTGFLVGDVEQAVAAVAEVGALDRARVRRHAVAQFGLDRMTDEYLAAYEAVVDRPGRVLRLAGEGHECPYLPGVARSGDGLDEGHPHVRRVEAERSEPSTSSRASASVSIGDAVRSVMSAPVAVWRTWYSSTSRRRPMAERNTYGCTSTRS